MSKKKVTIEEFKSIIKESVMKLNNKEILKEEKKRLVEELDAIAYDAPFSFYLIDKKDLAATSGDDPGDFTSGTKFTYMIPKDSFYGRRTEDEMYDMLVNMFGTGENGGPGRPYSRIGYNIEDAGDKWHVIIKETEAYDI